MALTLRRSSWMPVLLVLGGALGTAAVLGLAVGGLAWWIALASFLALGSTLAWIERRRKPTNLRPAHPPPPLRLIDGSQAGPEIEARDQPAAPTETPRWLM